MSRLNNKSEFAEAFDGITASEEAKQKAINKLLQYENQAAASVNAKKERRRFARNIRRVAAAASTAALVVFCAVFIPMLSNNGTPPVQQKLEQGFVFEKGRDFLSSNEVSPSSNEALPKYFCGYKSEKDRFEISGVEMDFYFGHNEALRPSNAAGATVKACFVTDTGDTFTVKEIGDFFTEKYKCAPVLDEETQKTIIVYNHSEKFSIPKNAFKNKEGSIIFTLYLYTQDGAVIENGGCAAAEIFYKLEGKTVVLSGTKF
ncbi:MAG: hypothetical protein FWD39_00060 [Clostridiales bacterium]|nr:hypothetical protein [Clostridiales bacterium]